MAEGSISKQGDLLVKAGDGSVINLADVMTDIQAGTERDLVKDHTLSNILSKLNVDASGRLRVSAESAVIASGTVTTVTNVTNLGNTSFAGLTVTAYQQLISKCGCFRNNLAVSA